jgi:hypothetical protein
MLHSVAFGGGQEFFELLAALHIEVGDVVVGRPFFAGLDLHLADGPFLQTLHFLGDGDVPFFVVFVEGGRVGGMAVEDEEADHERPREAM